MAERIHEPRTPIALREAWRREDAAIQRDAELFWRREGLLAPETNVPDRLADLCIAGYDGDRLIALTTARVRFVEFLGVNLAMLRLAVSRESRRNRLGTYLLASSCDLLERWSAENPAAGVMGMGTITQIPGIAERRETSRALLRDSRLAFIGWTANNEPMRVAWFAHGRIPTRRPGVGPPGS